MLIKYKKSKKKNLLYILLSILSSLSLVISLESHSKKQILQFLRDQNIVSNLITRIFSDIWLSISTGPLFCFFIFISVFMLIYYTFKHYNLNKKETIALVSISIILSFFLFLFQILNREIITNYIILRFSLKIIGYSLILYCLITIIFKNLKFLLDYNFSKATIVKNKKKIIIYCSIFIFACWIPYIIAYYPAMLNLDTVDQIRQIYGLSNFSFLRTSVQLSPNIVINDSHPVFLTFIISIFLNIGKLFNSLNFGMFLFVLIKVCISLYLFSYLIYFSLEKGINRYVCLFGLIFYSILPLFPMAAITIVKNYIFGIFYLIYLLMFYKLVFNTDEVVNNKKFLICFSVCQLFIMSIVKHGIYVSAITGMILILYRKKHWKNLTFSIFIPIFIFQVLFSSILLPSLGISKGKSAEMYSIPFQQTGLYITKHGEEVTSEEKQNINKVLYYDRIKKNYNPTMSDGIKDFSYRADCTGKDKSSYFKTWFKMFFKHPLTYFQATYMNNANYFNPNSLTFLYYSDYEMDRCLKYMYANKIKLTDNSTFQYIYNIKKTKNEYSPENVYTDIKINREKKYLYYIDKKTNEKVELSSKHNIWITPLESLKGIRDVLLSLTTLMKKIPGINIFMGLGTYAWICILIIVFGILKKKKDLILFMVPTIASYLIMIAGPYAGFRYAYPIVQSIFLLIVVAIKELNNNEELRKIKE
ncbi:DUF6020 family protein [Anaerofustis stercorihominis]|uniref:DUF6020 family protein n=1 Tax=Anaerofustis stercorihominis TaxID=214853 RepID=UPI00214C6146|nr:DUF6020 family protein [Anaerofustis stercorihominis]MCR2033578.1 DUF6020 family protein [Anaerofustis stercorihominis]